MNTQVTDPLILTDKQWGYTAGLIDYTDFTVTEFSDVMHILLDAREALNYTPTTPKSAAMPGLDAIELWDTGDDENEDLVLTVAITRVLILATDPIAITEFRADVPEGPAAARFVLEKLIAHRNELTAALAEYSTTGTTGGPSPKDATIVGDALVCPHCTAGDSIVEIDFDTRKNPVSPISDHAVGVLQRSPNHRTLRFECSACGGAVTIPYEVTY